MASSGCREESVVLASSTRPAPGVESSGKDDERQGGSRDGLAGPETSRPPKWSARRMQGKGVAERRAIRREHGRWRGPRSAQAKQRHSDLRIQGPWRC